MKNKCIAIVPARGGSKRVKRKNIVDIAGKPLLSYTLDVAKNSGIFDEVFVNSEDEEILDVAKKFGAQTYKRPFELSCDQTSVITVIQDMINSLCIEDTTFIFVLLPTAPLREKDDIIKIYEAFNSRQNNKAVVTVTTFDPPIQLAHRINERGELIPVFAKDYKQSTKSIGHENSYRFNECAVVNTALGFSTQTNLIGDNSIPFLMTAEKSMAIDYDYQKDLIELILKERKVASSYDD